MTGDPFSDQPVLVTGGAGFIGSHLVDALVERGARVRVLDDFSTGRRENLEHLGGHVELIEGDIRSGNTVSRACRGVRWVFHQAALGSVPRSIEDPATTYEVNLVGTVRVLDAAVRAGIERLVWASSSSVYGDSEILPKREGEEGRPLSPYAASKSACEQAARVFSSLHGLEAVGLRYFNVYGPRQRPEGPYAAVVPRFFDACLQGRSPTVYGDGEQSRDFTFVGDAVEANLLAATSGTVHGHQVVNVARGEAATINELARHVGELVASDATPTHTEPRAGDARHSLADLTEARSRIGYRPSTDLRSGLESCLQHYRQRHTAGRGTNQT